MNKTAYKKLLKGYLKEGYKFIHFNELNLEEEKQIILRHDVDFDVDLALEMANIENELGVKASYFFLTHGIYNFNNINHQEFNTLGHFTGLHVDYSHPAINRDLKLNRFYSVHRPSKEDLNIDDDFSSYSKKFFTDIQYASDSNFKEPNKIENNGQLLIHPLWWMLKGSTKDAKLKALSKHKKLALDEYIKDNMKL